MSLCLACKYVWPFNFGLVPRRQGRFALAATQVQQFNRVGVATTVATSTLDSCQRVYRRKENAAASALKFLNAGCQNIHQGILKADFAKKNKCACLFFVCSFPRIGQKRELPVQRSILPDFAFYS